MIQADPIVSKLMRFGPKYLFGLGASAYLFSLSWLRERGIEDWSGRFVRTSE